MTRRIRPAILAALAPFVAPSCGPAPGPPEVGTIPAAASRPHQLAQVATINALMVGRYDGWLPIADLLGRGDLGVGTLDHLDGELVILDGRAYQIRGDGRVLDVPAGRTTPFAVVAPFRPEGEAPCPAAATLADLDAHLAEIVPGRNRFAAIRVDGRFASLTMRSVARQEPPYRPLDEVAKGQSVWTKRDQVGTLVGIRSPAWVGGINVPGYHWHFLAADRRSGGHVLDCQVESATLRYDTYRDWDILLEDSPGFDAADLARDRAREVRRVESSRAGEPD